MRSPNLSGLALDNGPLTDAKIKRWILRGYYGEEARLKELKKKPKRKKAKSIESLTSDFLS